MRTNVLLDDKLVKEAFKYTNLKTKKALLNTALEEFIKSHKRLDIRDLVGKVKLRDEYDYKKSRKGRF